MGGKSRKSGGVSAKLIAQLKSKFVSGNAKKASCGKKPKTDKKGYFDGFEGNE